MPSEVGPEDGPTPCRLRSDPTGRPSDVRAGVETPGAQPRTSPGNSLRHRRDCPADDTPSARPTACVARRYFASPSYSPGFSDQCCHRQYSRCRGGLYYIITPLDSIVKKGTPKGGHNQKGDILLLAKRGTKRGIEKGDIRLLSLTFLFSGVILVHYGQNGTRIGRRSLLSRDESRQRARGRISRQPRL